MKPKSKERVRRRAGADKAHINRQSFQHYETERIGEEQHSSDNSFSGFQTEVTAAFEIREEVFYANPREKDSKCKVWKGEETVVYEKRVEEVSSEFKRPKRQLMQPLESWRAERRIFGFRNGEIVNLGYVEGSSAVKSRAEPKETIAGPKKTSTKTRCAITKKIIKTSSVKTIEKQKGSVSADPIMTENKSSKFDGNISEIYVINPSTGREQSVYLHRPFTSNLWSVPPSQDQKNPPFKFALSMTGEYISFGYVEVGVGKEKNEQFSPTDNITFTVIKGKITIQINKQHLHLNYLDKMTIPAGNGYKVKNTGKIPALLCFCSYKVPLFDYQFSENY